MKTRPNAPLPRLMAPGTPATGRKRPCGLTWHRRAVVLASLTFGVTGWAQSDTARTRLAALIHEGDQLSREAAALEPATRRSQKVAERLASEERQLELETQTMEQVVRDYNAAVGALASASTAQRERCTGGGLDAQQVRECNDELAKFSAQAASLEQRRVALEQRRQALNQSIERHNAARREWEQHGREQGSRTERNESKARRWLQQARAFRSTGEFTALAAAAGTPAACSSTRLSTVDAAHPLEALKRMQSCFKAVAR
jgi:chromosome segregation ATPase